MKKLLSKFFRVATEGATTDGRAITAQQIDQMAKNYNPAKYAARVWVEHLRSLLPDSPFKAYGDVTALKAETIEGKRVLLAQISPTSELVAMNQARQKLFSSIEMSPDFAGTGEAYLVGLAVTDTPASLGTEMMEFSAKQGDKSPLAARKENPANLFTACAEASLEFSEEDTGNPGGGDSFLAKVKNMLGNGQEQQRKEFSAAVEPLREAITAIAEAQRDLQRQFASLSSPNGNDKDLAEKVTKLSEQLENQQKEFTALVEKLGHTPAKPDGGRPPATGSDVVSTDC